MRKFIIIAGPTAVGKSRVAVELAKKLNTEVVSADSIQIYKGLDIGSAKITPEEMQGIKHHMLSIVEPTDSYSVKEYQKAAFKIIDELNMQHKIPIICGGTGFYINSLIYELNLDEDSKSDEIRSKLCDLYEKEGIEPIRAELEKCDPVSFDRIHQNDAKRNIRALEYFKCKGLPFSESLKSSRKLNLNSNFKYYALIRDREVLYRNIEKRIDLMIEDGLIDEVKTLYNRGLNEHDQSMQGIGYKEIFKYLKDEWEYDYAISKLKQFSRNYAKRQITWYRNDENAELIDADKFKNNDSIVDYIIGEIKDDGFLQ
ncbi:MAG: tRNA (adenosine(37)-N6)-dimethylallyltransferase MiaA [Ezakiella sp.]|nr:tRNA (adenosine(37)-N6)-dimethylallyltransferase MiaA [Ezakiella sp.]MDD7471895.1 tRNA (adenosine(37)-N6)-dimethylallyltransferase MiaA [Bacillota bacterium]MDY3923859.1 tRNA (adenosine(37)-N6)-dimethylallyltransferase MiaA [Ezakiella sp.]